MDEPAFELVKIDYRIEMLEIEEHLVAEITPFVTTRAKARQMLVASLCVDGHELLPSGKMIIGTGETTADLRTVRIIDPLTVNTPFTEGGYVMTMKIAGLDDKTVTHECQIDIPVQ